MAKSSSRTVNNARALRVTELMKDYRDIQGKIAAYSATPSEVAYNELGFVTLRQCHAEARALLNAPYPVELLHPPTAHGDAEKRQLQRFAHGPLPCPTLPFLPPSPFPSYNNEASRTDSSMSSNTESSSTPALAASKPRKYTCAPQPP